MKLSKFILILVLILLGVSVWINFVEMKKETTFSSAGVEIRVLEAAAARGLIKIVEPNGQIIIFSEDVKKAELTKIAERQKSFMTQLGYFYHRILRFVRNKLEN
ncbi:MAG: hypothetical protein GTO40_18005 [Deltaproteobacteria bacterium]|nr:hypothetical protein [Deltaproteobacteria bacterium]